MGKIENPLSSAVDTSKIAQALTYRDILLTREIKDVNQAVIGIKTFFSKETPAWKTEPVANDVGAVIQDGIPQEILYQFDPKNKSEFINNAIIIDQGMWAVPFAINHMRKELWEYEVGMHSMMPMIQTESQMPIQPPQPEKKSRFGDLFSKFTPQKPQLNRESPYYKQETQLAIYAETPYRWSLLKGHVIACIADPNSISFSSESTRVGMEYRLKVLSDFFNYWIVPKFLFLHRYACEIRLSEMERRAERAFSVLAIAQKRQDEANPYQNS